jgi:hypothetical protein
MIIKIIDSIVEYIKHKIGSAVLSKQLYISSSSFLLTIAKLNEYKIIQKKHIKVIKRMK